MSNSTPLLDQISSSQGSKEVTANAVLDAASPATAFGRHASACSGLTWGYYGFTHLRVNGVDVTKANSTLSLTASSTRYISADRAAVVTEVATAFAADKLALYKAVTGASMVSSYDDFRDPHELNRFLYGRYILAMADANKTLTYEQAMCESLELTGALTALRDVVVPTVPRDFKIFANTTGGFGVRIKTASGTSVTVADGKRAIVECDGTNVVRVTADT